MKRILFLFYCLFILAIGINNAAGIPIYASPPERTGVVDGIYSGTILVLDASGRPLQGHTVRFFAGNALHTQVSATSNSGYETSIDITTDASGQATAYMKVVSKSADDRNIMGTNTRLRGTLFTRDFIIYTDGRIDPSHNNSPVYSDDTTTRDIVENSPSGTNIGSAVSATDADSDSLRYSLTGTDASSFSLDFSSGQLKTSATLDYDTKSSYSVTVNAFDNKGGSDSIGVTINVTEANEAPKFADGTTISNISATKDTAITSVTLPEATDANSGDTITYTLTPALPAGLAFDASTRVLSGTPTAEAASATYTYTASDSALSATLTFTIEVSASSNQQNPSNNKAPVFSEDASTTRAVDENTASGQNIGSAVSATDANTGDTLTYSLSGTDASSFSIVSTSGQLQTSAALDYETKTSYSVTITVSDSASTASISVTINVTNVNEAPSFADGTSTTRNILEGRPSGTNIGTAVAATDPDTGDTLTYSLSGTDASSFSIVSTSGQLQTNAVLDSETQSSYSVTVSVSDTNSSSDSISVTINVTDVNEAPTFADGSSTTRSIAENTASGTNIGSAVAATDPDGDALIYSLSGTDASSFSIVSTSGQLRTSAALDYETKSSYSVTVSVSDGNGGTDSITVAISVTDANENRPPAFTDGSSTTRSIAENTASGTNIGTAVTATDADNDTLTYTLGGTDASSFSILSTSGQLRTAAALDYETQGSYSVVVTAADGNGGSASITVTIYVTDVYEPVPDPPPYLPPVFNSAPIFTESTSTSRSVTENTASNENIGDPISATDADGDTITYTLGGTDAGSFRIDSSTGQLRTAAALDYETQGSYSVVVFASDSNGGSASITVTIYVTDVYEPVSDPPPYLPPVFNSAPIFTEGPSTGRSVTENTASDENIGDPISATDANGDRITYTLGGTDAGSFRIDSSTGQLRTSAALDYETQDSYTVEVTATDSNGASASITVTIYVTDVDEIVPAAPSRSFTFIDASERPSMYWVDADVGALQSLTGPNVNRLVPDVQNATNVAVDMADGKIYWTEQMGDSSGRIRRANLDGTNVELVKELTSVPGGFAIDVSNDKLYLTNAGGKVQRMDLDGTGFQPDLIINLDSPRGVAVDAARGKVYWTEQTDNNSGRIRRANLDGTNVELVKELKSVVYGLTIDVHTNKLYLVNSVGKVQRFNVDGTNFEPDFIVNLDSPMSVAVDAADGKVYWTEGGRIRRADLDGSHIENVVTGLKSPVSLVLNVATVEVLTAASLCPPMYWHSQVGALQRLRAAEVEDIVPAARNITGIAVDVAGGKVYWTEQTSEDKGRVQRADLDGSNVESVRELNNIPYGIAVDASNGKLYVTNDRGKIQRFNLDGSGYEWNLIVNLDSPQGIAVDAAGGKVYWTEQTSKNKGRVRRADLDGSNVELVRELNSVPRGIAIDASKGKLYVPNARGNMHKLNVDGSKFHWNFIVNLDSPQGIAVDGAARKVYWTERGGIRRANLDGSHIEDVVTGLITPRAIIIIGATAAELTPSATTAAQPECDVDGNGIIGYMDAVLVAGALGTDNLQYDINADGSVDFLDLLLIFANFEEAAGAPLSIDMKFTAAQIDSIQEQIELLAATNDRSPAALRTLRYLRNLLTSAHPAETQLLANFPNPFNPETWIPYHLSKDADVTLRIYAVNGTLVRTLTLGYQPAGIYQNRSRAAYWDGRNAFGEPVASGVYFYTITAGDFTATRKMLIRK